MATKKMLSAGGCAIAASSEKRIQKAGDIFFSWFWRGLLL
jgi:hypothetical protein